MLSNKIIDKNCEKIEKICEIDKFYKNAHFQLRCLRLLKHFYEVFKEKNLKSKRMFLAI